MGTRFADVECSDHVVFVVHIWALFLAGHQCPAILSTPLLVENIFSSKSCPFYCRHRELERGAHYLEHLLVVSRLQNLAVSLHCKP
jgi:hypothetical protein